MGKRSSKILQKTNLFTLSEHTNQSKKSKRYYSIKVSVWKIDVSNIFTDMHNHFNPNGDRGSWNGVTWKFKNRKTAEQLLTMAIIKFE